MRKTALLLTPVLLLVFICLFGACTMNSGNDPETTEDPGIATRSGDPSEPATEAPKPTELPWQTDEQGRRLAGTDSKLTRDGTPKKYFTISFDDGITQDKRIIEIYNKYNFRGTFFINTGLFGANWTWVGETLGMPSLSHKRWTRSEILTGIYEGQDVASHTLNHPSLKNYSKDQVINEVNKDIENIFDITGIRPVGMAWPGGDPEYNLSTMEIVRDYSYAKFARATTATGGYKLPKCWLKWQPTCSITDGAVLKLAQRYVEKDYDYDTVFYVWGHGYELDYYDIWDRLDELIKTMTEADDVICVTNSEFYWLFKDEIPPISDNIKK